MPVIPNSHPGYAPCIRHLGRSTLLNHQKKLSQHNIAKTPLSTPECFSQCIFIPTGVYQVSEYLLGSQLASSEFRM